MAALNRCMFIGNVGKDPETKFAEGSGVKMTRFSVGVNRVIGSGESRTTVTTWINCVAERDLADLAQGQVRRGALVYVEGFLNLREYKDRAGQQRMAADLVLRDLQVLDRKEPAATVDEDEDEIRFD